MPAPTAKQSNLHLSTIPDWSKRAQMISRTFTFRGCLKSIAFVCRIARKAQKTNHHPEIDIRFGSSLFSVEPSVSQTWPRRSDGSLARPHPGPLPRGEGEASACHPGCGDIAASAALSIFAPAAAGKLEPRGRPEAAQQFSLSSGERARVRASVDPDFSEPTKKISPGSGNAMSSAPSYLRRDHRESSSQNLKSQAPRNLSKRL